MRRLITLLAGLTFALGAVACGDNGARTVVAEFVDIGDLVTRANVQQSDAVVGTVKGIELVERPGEWVAKVTLEVEAGTRVVEGTQAVVRSTSLLGERYVDLIAPDGDLAPLADGATIGIESTRKAPELEAVFSQLGAILQSGGLEDLARITTASAAILEGQEEHVGRVLDGTAKLIASLRNQKDALASALDDLASASEALDERSGVLDRALDVSADALGVVASQRADLEELIVQLDRLGGPLGRLTKAHKSDINEQIKIVNQVIPKVYEVRDTLEKAVVKLDPFTKLFARAVPGDYVQLDVFIEAVPVGTPTSAPLNEASLQAFFLEAAK